MRAITGFWGKTETWSPGSVKTAVGLLALWIATLNQESGDDTMKRRTIEEFQLGQIQEVFDVTRGIVREKSDFNVSQ